MADPKVLIGNVSEFRGLRTDTTPQKCPPNYSPDCSDLVFSVGGMSTRPPFLAVTTLPEEITYRKEFLCKDGSTQIVALGISGALYSVKPDGTYTVIDMVAPNSSANSVTAYGREYIAFFNASGGCDAPRQWDGKNIYRVSQGGPGAAPVFSAAPITTDSYPITSITQPAAHSRTSSYFLQADAVGGTSPGAVGVAYYSDSTISGPDTDLVNAFNSGFPVFIYFSFTGIGTPIGPTTVQVTSVGLSSPPSQPRQFYYFTFTMPTVAYQFYPGSGHPGYTANYQRSLATMITAVPVPGLTVGDTADIVGTSVAGYNSPWTIAQAFDSGELSITQTSLIAGVGTYNYLISSGVAATAGQLVTVTYTLNANGLLNVTNATIASVGAGFFTVNGLSTTTDYALTPDGGTAVTAGTTFAFDPGATTVGTSNSPIFGTATGGSLTFIGANQAIAPGKRRGVVMFLTNTDFLTPASDPVTFTIPTNTSAIAFSNLPIGPANVKARVLAFTGANGSRYFALLIPPQVDGITSGTSTVINDNVTTSGTVFFGDPSLLAATGIDIPGNNQFALTALNLPRGVNWYEDRLGWIGELNTVVGFRNTDMAGGTLSGSVAPLGWQTIGTGGAIAQVGFMPAYVVTGGTGEITQGAATTSRGAAILSPLLHYSLRFWIAGSSSHVGTFISTLSSAVTGFSTTATYNLAGLAHDGYVTITFDAPLPSVIPADLQWSVKFAGLTSSATTRDYQMIYADNPSRNPVGRFSYIQAPEAYDALTGNLGPNDDPTELRAIFLLQESLFFLTQHRLYSVQAIGNSEPSSWAPFQIADKCGGFNANSVVTGKGWAAWAGEDGVFWFAGSLPQKTSDIINPTWNAFADVPTMYNDSTAERVYFGTITTGGTRAGFMFDYHELSQGGAGKWTPWNRPLRWICGAASGTTFIMASKFYRLSAAAGTADDDFGPIGGYSVLPPLGVTMFKKTAQYMGLRIEGSGSLTPFLYAKTLNAVTRTLTAQDLAALLDTVAEWDINVNFRLLFIKIGQPGVQFTLTDATAIWQNDPNGPVSGNR